ncbi:MAG: hypothetical protein ABRQ27_14415 [Clostridiaceae bacterium]
MEKLSMHKSFHCKMWEAVFGDVGVTVLAVLNSMRAMKTDNIYVC